VRVRRYLYISGFSIQEASPGQDGSATSQSEAQRSQSSDSDGNTISNNPSGEIDQQIKRKRQQLHLEWTNVLRSYIHLAKESTGLGDITAPYYIRRSTPKRSCASNSALSSFSANSRSSATLTRTANSLTRVVKIARYGDRMH